jgi:excinuclease UvrABC nuclease subunit
MTEAAGIFDDSAAFDPAGDLDAFLKRVPARWVVYLLADADDRPAQLLCVKNLRVSLRRRLGPPEPDAPKSKRVDYRDLVRKVYFRRVDSTFEADWAYFEAARVLFPRTYQGMVGFRPAWFVHVDPAEPFPRYVKTLDPAGPTSSAAGRGGTYLGPLEDKQAAGRLVQLAEDAFDLCRYYPVLVESPHGKACAYKEMGKCPAPCDGSVSMGAYRQLVTLSLETLVDPRPMIRDQERRMREAAADLKFEVAGKIKQHAEMLGQLGKGPFRHARPLDDFRYVGLQHGPAVGTANVFVVTPGEVEHVACLIAEPATASSLLRLVFERGQRPVEKPLTPAQVERIGVVSHHLFAAKATQGVFLPLAEVEDRSLAKAYRDLMKQKRPEDEPDGEGIVKELDAVAVPGSAAVPGPASVPEGS